MINLLILFTLKLYSAWARGKQTVGELGLGNDRELESWTELEAFSQYISGTDLQHIYMGKQRFSLLDVQNNIFSVGSNMNGDCGVSSGDYAVFEWRLITEYGMNKQTKAAKDLELEIATLSNGMSAYHSFIYTKDDRLFVYGNLKAKQAGTQSSDICAHQTYSTYPVEITFKIENILKRKEKIVQIECGRFAFSHFIFSDI